jgi:hypothetical protein
MRRASGVRLVKLLKVIIWSGSGHLLCRMPFRRNQVSPFPSAFASIALVATAEGGSKRAPAGGFRGAHPQGTGHYSDISPSLIVAHIILKLACHGRLAEFQSG